MAQSCFGNYEQNDERQLRLLKACTKEVQLLTTVTVMAITAEYAD